MKKVKTVQKKTKARKPIKPKRTQYNPLYVMAGLVVITFVVFLPSLSNDFVNWDDPSYILNNARIQSFTISNIIQMFNPFPKSYLVSNYHPLTEFSLAIDHLFAGRSPKVYHFTNILIHAVNTVLVYLLVTRMLKGYQVAAIITAVFFSIHPMHVESVVWASERKDVLHVMFFLFAMLQYIKYLESNRENSKFLMYTGVLFVCSLLSKAQAVTLPIVLLLLDQFYGRKDLKNIAIEKVPFFILSLAFGLLAIKAQKSTQADALVDIALSERPFTGSMSLCIYLWKLIVPTGLCALHPYPWTKGEAMPSYFYPAILGMLAYLGTAFYAFRKGYKELFFGLAFFLMTIAPVLQFMTIGEALWAERYSYLPYIGLFFVIGYYVNKMETSVSFAKFQKPVLGVLAVAAVLCAWVSMNRIADWKDSPTLWYDVLEKYPDEKLAYVNLSHFFSEVGEFPKCQQFAEDGLKIAPDHYKLWVNKAFCMMKQGKHQAAIPVLLQGEQKDPGHYELYYNLGICYDRIGNAEKAMEYYDKTLEKEPDHIQAFLQKGVVYSNKLNNQEKALENFKKVISFIPNHGDALVNAAIASYKLNKGGEAADYALRAVTEMPNNGKAWYIKALSHSKAGQYSQALDAGRKAKAFGQSNLDSYLQQWEAALKK